MKVLFYSPGPDTCGLGAGMRAAFLAAGHEARHVRWIDSPWHYPVDIQDGDPPASEEIRDLWRAADVVHIFERPEAALSFPYSGKRIIVHHLGTHYRLHPSEVSATCRAIGAVECADMHDLIRINPALPWLPDVIDPAPLAALRATEYLDSPFIRIAHAPTNREYKSTDVIVAAIEDLSAAYPIRFDLIEGVSNAECVTRKARCDLFVDELTLGYGLNALECWSMGIPVVSGIADPATRELMLRDSGRTTPFVEATRGNLVGVLSWLCEEAARRRAWGEGGRAYLMQYHSPAAVVERSLAIYEGRT